MSLAMIVNLIGATRTAAGLRVRSELDRGTYAKVHDVMDAQMATRNLEPHHFHGDWNYTIHPMPGRK
jgi:DDE family transposase